jgi:hypothetical protein
VYGLPLEEFEKDNDIHLDGVLGSALLAEFRFTLVDGGKTMWLEEMPRPDLPPAQPDGQEPAPRGDEPVSSSPRP